MSEPAQRRAARAGRSWFASPRENEILVPEKDIFTAKAQDAF